MKRDDFSAYRRTYETVLVVVLGLIFMVITTQRIGQLRAAAEEVMVAQTVSAIRTGLSQRLIELALRGELDALAALDGANPIEFLDRPPAHYHTLMAPLPPTEMVGYRWYFDPATGMLTYRVANEDALITELERPARLRFQVRVAFTDTNRNARFDAHVDSVTHVDLVALEAYRWRGVK